MKHKKLNQWLWKWHFIAGIIVLPFILILSLTGVVYLFKEPYETKQFQRYREVVVQGNPISFQKQWELAQNNSSAKISTVILPTEKNQATEFTSGMFGHANSYYIDPYKGSIVGELKANSTDMYKVRKLHGDLLLGGFGTKIVELVGCWMVVLIITGLYVWWPERKWNIKAYFFPRVKSGRRTFFRDFHAITGFWLSALFLLILAGGLPWTDVFGAGFKWVQEKTHTGYPPTWNQYTIEKDVSHIEMIPLDDVVKKAEELNLAGKVQIDFPKGDHGVFSISNTYYPNQSQQMKYHIHPYTGHVIMVHSWADVGVLTQARMWVMAFHQGQFGLWNWILMLVVAVMLFLMSLSAVVSYMLRKHKNSWGVPKVPKNYKLGAGIIILLALLCVFLPLFGLSVIIICIFEKSKTFNFKEVINLSK